MDRRRIFANRAPTDRSYDTCILHGELRRDGHAHCVRIA